MAKFGSFFLGLVLVFCSSVVSAVTYFPSPAFPALTQNGRPLVGGGVTITNSAGAGVAAQIKGDLTGATSYSYVVPANGLVQFFGSADTYIVTVSASGVTLQWYVTLGSAGGGGGITELNTLTAAIQDFTTGTSGNDFNIDSTSSPHHKFNVPNASGSARGFVSTGTQTFAGAKTFTNDTTFGASISVTDSATVNSDGDSDGFFYVKSQTYDAFYVSALNQIGFFTDVGTLGTYGGWMVLNQPNSSKSGFLANGTGGNIIDANSTTGIALNGLATTGTAVKGVASSSGRAGLFQRSTDASSFPVVEVNRTNSSDTTPLLKLKDILGSPATYSFEILNSNSTSAGITPSGQYYGSSITTLLPIYSSLGDANSGFTVVSGIPSIVDEGNVIASFTGSTSPFLTGLTGGLVVTQDFTTYGAKIVRSVAASTDPVVWIQRDEDADSQTMLKFDNVNATPSGSYIWEYDLANTPIAALAVDGTFIATSPAGLAAYGEVGATDSGLGFTGGVPCLKQGGTNVLCATAAASPNVGITGDALVTGELKVTGVSGSQQAVCVKSDGNLGTCSTAVDGSGQCTCG